MNLGFMTKLENGEPTYFVEKIWRGFYDLNPQAVNNTITNYLNKGYVFSNIVDQFPKIHTIREDKSNRWKKGNKIHFVINNRQPNRFQFAPVIECTGVQHIMISDIKVVWINGKQISDNEILKQLAINDGFESVSDFFDYFPDGFQGKIIHWTNKRY